MINKTFFPWLRTKLGRPCAKKPMMNSMAPWANKTGPSSLLHQEICRRQLRESMARVERRMQACPIAPLQAQMQTVWFHLVHEYLKNKRKAVNDDTSHN